MVKGIQNFQEQVQTKTDQELQDIYLTPENYQPVFLDLVKNELVKRNIPIDQIESIIDERNAISDEKLELGKKGNINWIIFFFLTIIGGDLLLIAAISGIIYLFLYIFTNISGDGVLFGIFLTLSYPLLIINSISPILAGINYAISKTKNSQNEILYIYTPGTRKVGWWLFILGSIRLLYSISRLLST